MAEESVQLTGDGPPGGGSIALPNQETDSRPEGIPEKFWNEDKGEVDTPTLLSSYLELEQKIGQAPAETPAETPAQPNPSEAVTPDSFELAKYEEEFVGNNNSLTTETYQELSSKFGLEKGEIDNYIRFRQAESDSFNNEIFDMAGGEDQYRALLSWASSNLSETDITNINDTLTGSDKDQVRIAVMKLSNQYKESVGLDPKLLGGKTSQPTETVEAFPSLQAAVEARRDKRYDTDPSYREEWERKVGASAFVNNT